MGLEKHQEFLKQYGNSMIMAIDQPTKGSVSHSDEFFNEIYVPFSQEDELALTNAVQDADRFTIVAAPIGGGKSTIIYWALHNVKSETRAHFVFDFKRHMSSFYPMKGEPQDKARFMHDRFKDSLMGTFLPTLSQKLQFAFTTLQLFFVAERHEMEVRWSQRHPNLRIDENIDQVRNCFLNDIPAQEIALKLVRERLTCAMMIRAIMTTFKKDKFLLIFDNVDRCPIIDQPIMFSVAIDINHEGSGEFGTMVAIRNKNLMRFEEAGSDGDVVEVVSVTSQYTERTEPLRIHAPAPDRAEAILVKRQAHALQRPPLAGNIGFASSAEVFSQLREHINRAMIEERFQNLSNHSYRRMLIMHDGFVRYLFRLTDKGAIKVDRGHVDLTGWKTRSYLYRWLYATNNPDHKFLLDVVTRYERYEPYTDGLPLLCDVELVLLAWMVNNGRHSLMMGDLLRGFRKLAVGIDMVREGVYRLYSTKPLLRHIELGDCEERVSPDDIKQPECRLKLNPLGAEFVQHTITIFEFLHQCLAYPDITSEDSEEMLEPIESDIQTKISRVYDFLLLMKNVHVEVLRDLREGWQDKHEDWETYYRKTFCIRENLILERIAVSHLSHFRIQFPSSFDEWRPKYFELIEDFLYSIKSSRTVEQSLYGV